MLRGGAGLIQRNLKNTIKPADQIAKWKILRGDTVQVMAGKEKGKTGVVVKCIRDQNRIIIDGLNLVKKHVKGTPDRKGGILEMEAPLHVSNVMLLDPVTKKPTRVGFGYLDDGGKERIAKRSGAVIPRPVGLKDRRVPRPATGPSDTPPDVVTVVTYKSSPS